MATKVTAGVTFRLRNWSFPMQFKNEICEWGFESIPGTLPHHL